MKEGTHRKRHILDLILTREDEISEIDVSNHGPVISDHSALSFHLPFHRPYSQQETNTYRKIQNINIEQFVKDVEASDLCSNPEDNLDDLIEQYNTTLHTILDKHSPQIRKIKRHNPLSPWFTEEHKLLQREYHKTERQWRKNKLAVNLEIYKQAYY